MTDEKISKYHKIVKDPVTKDIWMESFGKYFGKLSQGDNKTKIYSMGSIFVMERHEIKNIPKDGTITYSHVVVGFRPQKEDPK